MTQSSEGLDALLVRVEAAETLDWRLFVEVSNACYPPMVTNEDVEAKIRLTDLIGAEAWTDAALALCERVLPGHMVEMGRYTTEDEGPDGCFARVSRYCHGDGPRWESDDRGIAPTLPLALLAAMLKAIIASASTEKEG